MTRFADPFIWKEREGEFRDGSGIESSDSHEIDSARGDVHGFFLESSLAFSLSTPMNESFAVTRGGLTAVTRFLGDCRRKLI